MAVFRWLHITDLHLGARSQPGFLPTVKGKFLDDVESYVKAVKSMDLVLFTGDLVQAGTDYALVDAFLDELWTRLRAHGCDPQLITCPGNHDLVRPARSQRVIVSGLRELRSSNEAQDQFWSDPEDAMRKAVETAFTNYQSWWNKCPYIRKEAFQTGMLPGDCSTVVPKDGVRLGIVALNSSFIQLGDGDYREYLAIDPRQLEIACNNDAAAWAKQNHACILMTHHPPSWFYPEARNDFDKWILSPGNFFLHLCGHLHETHVVRSSVGGNMPRTTWQGKSLFSAEPYTAPDGTPKKDRNHGYCFGQLTLKDSIGSYRFWARALEETRIRPDNGVEWIHESSPPGATEEDTFPLHRPVSTHPRTESPRASADPIELPSDIDTNGGGAPPTSTSVAPQSPTVPLPLRVTPSAGSTVASVHPAAVQPRRGTLDLIPTISKRLQPIAGVLIVSAFLLFIASVGLVLFMILRQANQPAPNQPSRHLGPGVIPATYWDEYRNRVPTASSFVFCPESSLPWLQTASVQFMNTMGSQVNGNIIGYGTLDAIERIAYNAKKQGNVGKQSGCTSYSIPAANVFDDAFVNKSAYWQDNLNIHWKKGHDDDIVRKSTERKIASTRLVLLMNKDRTVDFNRALSRYNDNAWWLLRDLADPNGDGWGIVDTKSTGLKKRCRIGIDDPLSFHSGASALILMYVAYRSNAKQRAQNNVNSFEDFLLPMVQASVESTSGQTLSYSRFDNNSLGNDDIAICYESDAFSVLKAKHDLEMVALSPTLEISITIAILQNDDATTSSAAGRFSDFLLTQGIQELAQKQFGFHPASEKARMPTLLPVIVDKKTQPKAPNELIITKKLLNDNLLAGWKSDRDRSMPKTPASGTGVLAPHQEGHTHAGRQ